MHLLQNLKNYFAKENKILEENYYDVQKANKVMLKWLLGVGIASFFILFLISFFEVSYESMRISYLIMFLLLVLVFFIYQKGFKVPVLLLLYGGYIILISICIYTSSFITDDATSVITVIFLVQAPIAILDKGWRICIWETSMTIIYIIFVILYKDKGFVVDECVNVIVAAIIGMVLGTHLRRAQIDNFDLKRQAIIRENTDTLTKIGSRRKLFEDLVKMNEREVSSIIMIDIDNFKSYNDTYGHQKGDDCLAKIGEVFLELSICGPITFYRYGGEEFIGIIYEQDRDRILELCNKVIHSIFDLQIIHEHSPLQYVTMSLGLAFIEGEIDYDRLIYHADQALYKAKAKGKNTFYIYDKNKKG